jgi:hypothetical protein
MDWNYIVTEIIVWALGVVLSALGVAATTWFEAKKKQEQANAENVEKVLLLDTAENAVTAAVDWAQQTIVSKIKGTEDWTTEAKEEALESAKEMFTSIMGEDSMKALESAVGNLSDWLNAKVEAAVLKKNAD